MAAAPTPTSIRQMALAMVCVLWLCGLAWAQNPPPAKPVGNDSPLRKDPALQVKLTVKFKRPKAQDIVERLRAEAKLDLTLADNIDQTRPTFDGLSFYNTPVWVIMDQLAKSQIIQGKWERHGNGYILTSPLPPPVPPAEPPPPPGPTKLIRRYFLFALPLLTIFGIFLFIRYRRRARQTVTATAPLIASKKSPSSTGIAKDIGVTHKPDSIRK